MVQSHAHRQPGIVLHVRVERIEDFGKLVLAQPNGRRVGQQRVVVEAVGHARPAGKPGGHQLEQRRGWRGHSVVIAAQCALVEHVAGECHEAVGVEGLDAEGRGVGVLAVAQVAQDEGAHTAARWRNFRVGAGHQRRHGGV